MPKENETRNHKIEITHGMSGIFCVHTAEVYDKTLGWYKEIIQSGIGRYKGSNALEKAKKEAKTWSEADNIPLALNAK